MLDLFEYFVLIDGEIEFFGWDATNKIAYLFGGSLQIQYDKNASYLDALDDLKKYYNDYKQQDLQLSMLANLSMMEWMQAEFSDALYKRKRG